GKIGRRISGDAQPSLSAPGPCFPAPASGWWTRASRAVILIDALHGNTATGVFFAGDLIGFSAELLITVLLLVLTLGAIKLPGMPRAHVFFALCAFLWSAGGLAYTASIAAGIAPSSHFTLVALAVHFTGAVFFPLPILSLWRGFAKSAWQKTASRFLL